MYIYVYMCIYLYMKTKQDNIFKRKFWHILMIQVGCQPTKKCLQITPEIQNQVIQINWSQNILPRIYSISIIKCP